MGRLIFGEIAQLGRDNGFKVSRARGHLHPLIAVRVREPGITFDGKSEWYMDTDAATAFFTSVIDGTTRADAPLQRGQHEQDRESTAGFHLVCADNRDAEDPQRDIRHHAEQSVRDGAVSD